MPSRRTVLLIIFLSALLRLDVYPYGQQQGGDRNPQDAVQTVQTLINALRDSSTSIESALEAGQTLLEMWRAHEKEPDGAVNHAIRNQEKSLEEILESSNSRRVRNSVALILYGIDTPEARAANSKRVEREDAERKSVDDARKIRQTTPQLREQVLAAVRLRTELDVEDLSFSSMENLLPDNESLVVTTHENRSAQLLELWFRQGDQFNLLQSLPVEDRSTASLGPTKVFTFGGEKFLLLPVLFSGTGLLHEDHIYHLDLAAHTLQDVASDFVAADFKLAANEGPRRGPFVTYDDDNISFFFEVWCDRCSDVVSGKYVIERNSNSKWTMRPAQVVRRPNNAQ
jgi:hypothetical protein